MMLSKEAIRGMEECRVPEHMRGALQRYFDDGIPPGDFLRALLANDMMEAMARADSVNLASLPAYGKWLYAYAPSAAYGSYEGVKEWIARHQQRREAESA